MNVPQFSKSKKVLVILLPDNLQSQDYTAKNFQILGESGIKVHARSLQTEETTVVRPSLITQCTKSKPTYDFLIPEATQNISEVNFHSYPRKQNKKVSAKTRQKYYNEVDTGSLVSTLHLIKRFSGFEHNLITEFFKKPKSILFTWKIDKKNISKELENHIKNVARTLIHIDRGNSEANFKLLNLPYTDTTLWELLAQKKYEQVKEIAGLGKGRAYLKDIVSERAELHNRPPHFGRSLEKFWDSIDEKNINFTEVQSEDNIIDTNDT